MKSERSLNGKWRWLYAGLAISALGLLLWILSPTADQEIAAGKAAPDFHLADLSGRIVSLSENRGKVILVDFWATWCPACVSELPAMKELYRRFFGPNFDILAVTVDETDPTTVAQFVARRRIDYRVLFGDAETSRNYGIWGLPAKFLINQRGVVYRKYIGKADAQELQSDIDKLIKRRTS